MKALYPVLLVLLFNQLFAQDQIGYNCTDNSGDKISIDVTPSSAPLSYQGKSIWIYKYEIKASNENVSKFFIYKFNKKLYLLNGTDTKLNPFSNQALFELPMKNYFSINHKDALWENTELSLNKFYSINNKDFYIYDIKSSTKESLQLKKLIFDQNLDISEFEFLSNNGSCSCTKKRIVINIR